MTTQTPVAEQTHDWPSYWFVRLERAIDTSDFQLAAEAQRELRRLGYEVRIAREGRRDG